MYQQGKGKSKLQKGCTPHTFSSFRKFNLFCLIFLFSKFKKWILSKILHQNGVYVKYFWIREMWHKNWINEKRQRNFSMKHASLQNLKTFAFVYAGFIFSVKTFSTMKKNNKSYAWKPSISNLALLFFFCKIWSSKVWKCNEAKRLDFYQFLRFWVVKTFLKSYGSFFNYIGEGWDTVTWFKKLNLKK